MSLAHIYTRVSTDEQAAEGYSLQAQERACRLFCELHGHQVARVYVDDGYSGASAARPAFLHLVASVAAGDLILVHKLDRFTRNTQLLLETLDDLDKRGVSLISISEQIDFSSAIGKVILTILAAFAQYYLDNLRQETAKGLKEKAQRGLWVGPVPFGYKKEGKELVPSDDADIVREIYRLFVEDELSYDRIAAELNRRGLRTYSWKTKQHREWTREAVRTILRNRAYMGKVSSGGEEFDGAHAPLISAELWAAAAARREEQSITPNGGPRAPSWAQLLRCARCGRPLWFRYGGRGLASVSYRCAGAGRGSCAAPQFGAGLVESSVLDLADLLALPPADLGTAIEAIYVDSGEIIALAPAPSYRRLLERLGYSIRASSALPD